MVSTTAVMETQFTEQFREFLKTETDPQLRRLREDAFAVFAEVGFPTVKSEDWKYTNVAAVVSGQWSVADGKSQDLLALDIEIVQRFKINRNGFAALNLALPTFR